MNENVIERALAAMVPVGDGWTVYGRAVPYEVDQRVTDDQGRTWYLERFQRASFARDADNGGQWVNLFIGHGGGSDGERWLGRCTGLEDRRDGLYASFRLNRAHPQAEAARSGDLRGWSVSAQVRATRIERTGSQPVTVRESCALSHVAATANPQYATAGVLVARSGAAPNRAPLILANTRRPGTPTVIYPDDRVWAWARMP